MEYDVLDKWAYRSEKIENITKAILKFQKECGFVKKENQGQFKYAALETILWHILPKLSECDILLEQSDLIDGSSVYLRTSIIHITGEFKSSFDYLYSTDIAGKGLNSVKDAGDVQKTLGTIKTYQCRYALKNLLCLPIVDPDFEDGKYLTKIQQNIIEQLALNNEKILATVMKELKVSSLDKIYKEEFDQVATIISRERKGNNNGTV